MATQKYRERMAESAPNCSSNGGESEDELEGEKDQDKQRGQLLKESNQKEDATEEEEDEVRDDQNQNLKRKRKMKTTMKEGDDCSAGGGDGGLRSSNGLVVRREGLFPRMTLRILLVEADDSTRQIIAVLLRKCSYRVAAVADGLTAWEVLKQRPHNIDLILTEFDLPSISGYALLSLIMEHDLCKNIPVISTLIATLSFCCHGYGLRFYELTTLKLVLFCDFIVMSKEDSISTVYKCMVRGAADYLVKPVRRNELRNLWQHQLSRDNFPQDESVGQDRTEAASENNAATNHSTGNVACVQKNNEYVEKGSVSQSSCTKPDVEAESTGKEQDLLQQVGVKSSVNETKVERCEAFTSSHKILLVLDNEADGSNTGECNGPDARTTYKDVRAETERTRTDLNTDTHDSNRAKFNREGIDVAFGCPVNKCAAENMKTNFDSNPDLDPSLKCNHSGDLEIQGTEEKHSLRHSNTSAFTRYIGKPLHSQHSIASVCNQKDHGTDSVRNFPSVIGDVSVSHSPSLGVHRTKSLPISQVKKSELGISIPPCQNQANDLRISDLNTGYCSMFPPFVHKKSAAAELPRPCSAKHPESPMKVNPQPKNVTGSAQFYDQPGHASASPNSTWQKQDAKFESRGHISLVIHQNGSSSSLYNVDQAVAESKNEGGVFTRIRNSRQWSMEREAALNKFCLKRKERCFAKKVRYESRKKLAEQRPRVKGQFVRKAPVEKPE
ncbi:Two-component response regulator-like APRR5 [Linum grandiflorum]